MRAAILAILLISISAQSYAPIVQKLVNLTTSNAGFAQDITTALADPSRGQDNTFYGFTLDQFFGFFQSWYAFYPPPNNALYWMTSFPDFYSSQYNNIPSALQIVNSNPMKEWIYEFLEAKGQYLDTTASLQTVPQWEAALNMSQYIIPEGGYKNFNLFFHRDLAPGARPIASPGDNTVLITPCDSWLDDSFFSLGSGNLFTLKQQTLNACDFLANEPLCSKFDGGQGISMTLGTHDYHHYHAPLAGTVVAQGVIPGQYYGQVEQNGLFYENHRGYHIIQTQNQGLVAVIEIGMDMISSCNMLTKVNQTVAKGDDIGFFAYGGSTAALLLQSGVVSTTQNLGNSVLMGQQIATLNNISTE